jgi:hypothetical protein
MEHRVMSRFTRAALILAIGIAAPVSAHAQAPSPSRAWFAIGGASTTLQGACGEGCDLESAYLNTASLLVSGGYRVNSQMDTGVELFWTSAESPTGGDGIRSTFVLGVVNFRPWESKGFSIKGGMGMAFMRNWIYDPSGANPAFRSKALGLTYGAGWTFRRDARMAIQIFGAQHVAALGDLQTSRGTAENVIANFWSAGAVLLIR